jgi:hypothetical protein
MNWRLMMMMVDLLLLVMILISFHLHQIFFSFGIIVGFCNFVICDCGDVESLLGLFTVLIVGLLLR